MSEMPLLMDPEELIRQIEEYGFRMFIGADGIVHGKAVKPGTAVPWEMRPLLNQLQLQNEAVADLLRGKDPGTVTLKDATLEEAQPWLDRVNAGEYRLVGQVVYSRKANTASFTLERVVTVE